MGFQIEFLPENFLMDYRFSIYIGRKYLEIKITFFQKNFIEKEIRHHSLAKSRASLTEFAALSEMHIISLHLEGSI